MNYLRYFKLDLLNREKVPAMEKHLQLIMPSKLLSQPTFFPCGSFIKHELNQVKLYVSLYVQHDIQVKTL